MSGASIVQRLPAALNPIKEYAIQHGKVSLLVWQQIFVRDGVLAYAETPFEQSAQSLPLPLETWFGAGQSYNFF
jgi:hypothetical protein